MAQMLMLLPTVLFWFLVLFVLIAELIGAFAHSIRPRFRGCVACVLLMLGMWYAAETAHNITPTLPDFQPWTHFYTTTPSVQ